MWHAFIKKQGQHVLALLLSENADKDSELETWGSPTKPETRVFEEFSGAIEWIRAKRPAVINVVDPGGWGRFPIPDLDRIVNPV